MANNPQSNDPSVTTQPAGRPSANAGGMEDIPLKPSVPATASAAINVNAADEAEAKARQEEALTLKYAIDKLVDFLQWFVIVLEVTLLIRFVLRLIGAYQQNLFAGFIYALTDIILVPFSGIVPSPALSQAGPVFEWSTLIAIIVYWLVFWAIRRFLSILTSRPEGPPS